jgi:hypothetical protein
MTREHLRERALPDPLGPITACTSPALTVSRLRGGFPFLLLMRGDFLFLAMEYLFVFVSVYLLTSFPRAAATPLRWTPRHRDTEENL